MSQTEWTPRYFGPYLPFSSFLYISQTSRALQLFRLPKFHQQSSHSLSKTQLTKMCPSGTCSLAKDAKRGDFKPAFDVLDADHDGKISKDDLRTFYAGFSNGGAADDDIIGSMMSVADFNRDGFVEYDEFERVLDDVSCAKKKSNYGVMEDVFKVMDKDGDGKLSVDDLKNYMQWAGFDANDDDIKAMIRLAGGGDKDGVTYDDLLRILAL